MRDDCCKANVHRSISCDRIIIEGVKTIRNHSEPFSVHIRKEQRLWSASNTPAASEYIDARQIEEILDWEENACRSRSDLLATDMIFVGLGVLLTWLVVATTALALTN